ncbi:MAG: TrkA family potassium uptake protein [Propionibacteriaceae bacterium]|jgi:trk system potassium uptake protein TrkA|nr:TrkA family potassium uptake protein [Propionibacteriaceae bacterium]
MALRSHYVVMGCGRVGAQLAQQLEALGMTVAVIDPDPRAFERLDGFTGSRIVGIGFDRTILQSAGIEKALGFAAVTDGDNSNIIAARVAREYFGVDRVVARIYDPSRAVIYRRLGIATVATVRWTADEMVRQLIDQAPGPLWTDPTRSVTLTSVTYDPAWIGKATSLLEQETGVRLAAIGRFGRAITPDTTSVIQDQDILYLMAPTDRLPLLEQRLARPPQAE